jgi:hypothetical protein
LEIIEKQK